MRENQENTIRYYNDVIGTFVNRLDRRLYEVTAFDLRLYLSLYKEERKVNNRTLENISKVLSSFFGWLYDVKVYTTQSLQGSETNQI